MPLVLVFFIRYRQSRLFFGASIKLQTHFGPAKTCKKSQKVYVFSHGNIIMKCDRQVLVFRQDYTMAARFSPLRLSLKAFNTNDLCCVLLSSIARAASKQCIRAIQYIHLFIEYTIDPTLEKTSRPFLRQMDYLVFSSLTFFFPSILLQLFACKQKLFCCKNS